MLWGHHLPPVWFLGTTVSRKNYIVLAISAQQSAKVAEPPPDSRSDGVHVGTRSNAIVRRGSVPVKASVPCHM